MSDTSIVIFPKCLNQQPTGCLRICKRNPLELPFLKKSFQCVPGLSKEKLQEVLGDKKSGNYCPRSYGPTAGLPSHMPLCKKAWSTLSMRRGTSPTRLSNTRFSPPSLEGLRFLIPFAPPETYPTWSGVSCLTIPVPLLESFRKPALKRCTEWVSRSIASVMNQSFPSKPTTRKATG